MLKIFKRCLPHAAGQTLPEKERCPLPASAVQTATSAGYGCDTGLVIDVSGSMTNTDWSTSRLDAALDAAVAFVDERALIDPYSRIAVVGFSDVALPVCPLTPITDTEVIMDAIDSLTARSSTNITAGLMAAEQFLYGRNNLGCSQEILLLTDGEHNVGPAPFPVAERLKARGCMIYVVGIGGDASAVNEVDLKQIASVDQGGAALYRFIGDPQRLVRCLSDFGRITR